MGVLREHPERPGTGGAHSLIVSLTYYGSLFWHNTRNVKSLSARLITPGIKMTGAP